MKIAVTYENGQISTQSATTTNTVTVKDRIAANTVAETNVPEAPQPIIKAVILTKAT